MKHLGYTIIVLVIIGAILDIFIVPVASEHGGILTLIVRESSIAPFQSICGLR